MTKQVDSLTCPLVHTVIQLWPTATVLTPNAVFAHDGFRTQSLPRDWEDVLPHP